jgi:hypothetical protein
MEARTYTEDLVVAAQALNARLDKGGVDREYQLPAQPVSALPAHARLDAIHEQFFLAVEDGMVRGGYAIKRQQFMVGGRPTELAFYYAPVSEGIVDRAHAAVGAMLLRHALEAQPLLFALGMGGFERPLPRMLKALGWSMCPVPFSFRICHPARVLRGLPALRTTRSKRLLADLAALSGAGWLGVHAVQAARAARSATVTETAACSRIVDSFSRWADDIWEAAQGRSVMIAVRDRTVLNALYPPEVERFIRIEVEQGGSTLGWAVLLDTRMRGDKHFGSLRVGTIVDCLALPGMEHIVVQAATRLLERRGVDLIVSNQAHADWTAGLAAAGFLQGPSNFVFAASKQLSALLAPFEQHRGQLHLNRGDGDGPIHL